MKTYYENPLAALVRIQNELNQGYCNLDNASDTKAQSWSPRVDIQETEDAFLIHADVPGVSQEDIDIQIEGRTLTLRGERKHTFDVESTGFKHLERTYGQFARKFTLKVDVDQERIAAVYRNGTLELTLPKAVTEVSKKIEVVAA